jgi:hypothetical protein
VVKKVVVAGVGNDRRPMPPAKEDDG